MKIESAQITMQGRHVAYRREQLTLAVERWSSSSDRPASAPPRGEVLLGVDDGSIDDPRLLLLRAMIERMLGITLRVIQAEELSAPETATYSAAPPPPVPRGSGGQSLSVRAERVEYEHVGFSASGVVRTADGREIRFDIAFEMEWHHAERFELDIAGGERRELKDPLILDFAGPGAALSDLRFAFDLDADGVDDEVPIPVGGRGFLAFDRNGNGRIDDGRELFGPTSGNGFTELAALDADGNGWIDKADPAFRRLYLWQPDVDGKGSGSLQTLAEAGVGALSLASVATPFTLRDAAGRTQGVMRQSGIYLNEDGRIGTVSQIDLSV